jgi:hypothetical protein
MVSRSDVASACDSRVGAGARADDEESRRARSSASESEQVPRRQTRSRARSTVFRESRSVKKVGGEDADEGADEDEDEDDMAVRWGRARGEPWSVVCDVTELRRGVDENRMRCPKFG